jgi:hypothetical protein
MIRLLNWLWKILLLLAANPAVRKMLWGWMVDLYTLIKSKLKREDPKRSRSTQVKRSSSDCLDDSK